MPKKKAAKKSKGMSTAHKVGIGVGITAAAAAAAGAYFLYGSKDAKQNRSKVRSWVLKAKAEVLEALESADQMTREEYESLVEGVSAAYGKLRDVTNAELGAFEREMKGHWGGIEKSGKKAPAKKAAKKAPKKAGTKVAKKAAKKAPKKAAKKAKKKA